MTRSGTASDCWPSREMATPQVAGRRHASALLAQLPPRAQAHAHRDRLSSWVLGSERLQSRLQALDRLDALGLPTRGRKLTRGEPLAPRRPRLTRFMRQDTRSTPKAAAIDAGPLFAPSTCRPGGDLLKPPASGRAARSATMAPWGSTSRPLPGSIRRDERDSVRVARRPRRRSATTRAATETTSESAARCGAPTA